MSAASRTSADVVVIGGGLAGLTASLALADRGARVLLLDDDQPGQASRASAGMLAPSIHPAPGAAGAFARRALEFYPRFLDALHARTGDGVPRGLGVLHVPADEAEADRSRRELGVGHDARARWLDPGELRALEPALHAPFGAALHPDDGWVHPPTLLLALQHAVALTPTIATIGQRAVALHAEGATPSVTLGDGSSVSAARTVVAAGAWSSTLGGLPSPLRVAPLRGQMLALDRPAVRHVVVGAGGYLVPHPGATHVGATSEHAGLDPAITTAARDELLAVAAGLCPTLEARVARQWAGIRPMTPDGQPILGRDPRRPDVILACGFSRNGVLLAPLAAECVAALALDEVPEHDLSPFGAARFD